MMMCNRFVSDPWEQKCQNIIFENSKSCRKLWPLCWPVKTILFREKNVLLNVSVLELDSWGQTGNLQTAELRRIFWTYAKFCFTNQSTIAKLHTFHWTFTDFPLENLIQTWLRFLTQGMGCFLWSLTSSYQETYFSSLSENIKLGYKWNLVDCWEYSFSWLQSRYWRNSKIQWSFLISSEKLYRCNHSWLK